MRSLSDFLLALGMLVTGSINTISTKLADLQNATGVCEATRTRLVWDNTTNTSTWYNTTTYCDNPREFNHPFTQTSFMFLGEMMCLLTFKLMIFGAMGRKTRERSKSTLEDTKPFSPFIFVLPACCDLTATSCMYVGLTMTYASVFQMLRGSVVIFTGILSVVFLRRKLYVFHWLGMFCVLIGAAVVGVASVITPAKSGADAPSNPLAGDVLIVVAQIIVAVQMVVEEKLVVGKNVPALQAVGWEGFWGLIVMSLLLVIFYYLPPLKGLSDLSAGHHFENSIDAFKMMGSNGILLGAMLANVASIAFFNFFGISVTKAMSAAHRMVLDSLRTIVIWAVGIAFFKEEFAWLQLVGFVVLLFGTGVFNELVPLPGPCFQKAYQASKEAAEARKKRKE